MSTAMGGTSILLLLCFILAQADKQVVGLLALQIQDSFALSNTQLGFLQGGAFAIAFAIGGLPISRLIDRGHRIRLAAICVGLWSIATILCGVAVSFAMLLIFRAATAVAEAGLPPAAFSIFSQQEDSRRVARLTGIFMLAPFIGAGLMLILGGWLLGAVSDGFSLGTNWEPWRLVMIAVGVPGLLLAPALALFGREPARTRPLPSGDGAETYRAVFAHIFSERPFLRYYYVGLSAFYLATASLLAWYPALLVREMGLGIGTAGVSAGLTYLAGGVAGTIASTAYFSSRPQLTPATIVRAFLIVTCLLAPVLVALPHASSLPLSLVAYGLFAFLSAGVLAIMPVPIQLGLPERMRARGTAIISLLMSALAGTLGPLFVGAFMDLTGQGLGTALSVALAFSAVLSIWSFHRSDAAREQKIQ
jgi:MFS family permease